MIALQDVSIFKPGLFNRAEILVDANASFKLGERVGILAAPGSGKSTIARLLAGIERPDRGHVLTEGRVSWPIGFAGFLHPNLTVRDNLSIFARVNGLETEAVIAYCEELCRVEDLVEKMMQDLTPTQRLLLAYACALSVPGPAMWIADEVISAGQPQDRTRCDQMLAERLETGGLIFLSRNVRQLKQRTDRHFVLINHHLMPCDDLDVANEALELSMANRATRN